MSDTSGLNECVLSYIPPLQYKKWQESQALAQAHQHLLKIFIFLSPRDFTIVFIINIYLRALHAPLYIVLFVRTTGNTSLLSVPGKITVLQEKKQLASNLTILLL